MSAAIQGIEQVVNRFLIIESSVKNLEPAMKAAGVYMLGSIERNFAAQGRPAKWQALAPSTLEQRREGKGQGGPQILVNDADLKNSVTTQGAMQTTSNSMNIGTNKVQAARMHFGYGGFKDDDGWLPGHSPTPARPFLLFQTEDADGIVTLFNRHLKLS